MNPNYNKQVSNSDEGEHDASFEQKKDAYFENATSDDSGKETMSFNSGEEEVKMAEKFDSNASASSSSIEGDGDWSEKEDTAAKGHMARNYNGHRKLVEVEGRDPTVSKGPMSVHVWLNLAERRSSQTTLASVSQTFPRRQTVSGRECPEKKGGVRLQG